MAKALIISESKTGETNLIGEFISKKLIESGIDADLKNAKNINDHNELLGYDILIVGSDTECGDMMKRTKSILESAENVDLSGKIGGSFGTFGCCGEGPKSIYNTMKMNLKMDMVNEPFIVKSERSSIGAKAHGAYNYADVIVSKLESQEE